MTTIGLAAYSGARDYLVSLHVAHVLPVLISTFNGTVKPAGSVLLAVGDGVVAEEGLGFTRS